MPKKYLYNTEKNAYVEITDENKSLVKEKYAANPSIYKIYETEEPPVEEQEGGEPVNFTEGSVEQQEQPTEPLEKPIVDVDRFDVPETDEYLSGAREAAAKELRETEKILSGVAKSPTKVLDYKSYDPIQLDSAMSDVDKKLEQINFILSTRGLTQPQRTTAKKERDRLKEEKAIATVVRAVENNNYGMLDDAKEAIAFVGPNRIVGKELSKEYEKLESRVNNDINEKFVDIDFNKLTEIDNQGIERADVAKISDLSDEIATSMAEGDEAVRQLVYEKLFDRAENNRFINESIKRASENEVIQKLQSDKLSSFQDTNESAIKFKAEASSSAKKINDKTESELNTLSQGYTKNVQNYFSDLQSKVSQGLMTAEDAQKDYDSYNQELYKNLKEQQNLIVNEAESAIKGINELYSQKIQKGYEEFSKNNPLSQEERDLLSTEYGKIYEEIRDDEFKRLKGQETLDYIKYGGAGLAFDFGKSLNSTLSRAISGAGTYFGSPSLVEIGDEMNTSFSVADEPLENWSDLANIPAVTKSIGRLAGSAAPSIIVGSAVSAGTAGLGTVPAMALVATTGFVTESIDMAGNIKRDVIRETGSLLKGEQAAGAMWEAQMGNWWTYLGDGLPFVSKALKFIPSKTGRILTAGGESVATETPQEIFQTSQEQKIMESVRSGEEISAKGFMELITPELAKSTFLEVAPGSLFLGGGSRVVTEVRMQGQANQIVRDLIDNINLNGVDKNQSFIKQKIFSSINRHGKNFTNSWLSTLQENGVITEEQLTELYTFSKTAEGFSRNIKNTNLTDEQQQTYFGLSHRANELFDKADAITDDKVLKSSLTQEANELKKNAQSFLSNPETGGSFVTVKIGKSPALVLTESEAIEFVTNNPYVVLPESGVDIVARNADEFGGILEQMAKGVEAGIADLKSIDDYGKQQSEEGRLSDVDNTLTKINNAEYINDSEIDAGIEQIFDEVDRVDGLDISDNAKESIKQQLFGIAETLDNYEFRTKTETRKVTPEQPVEGRAETKREIPKKSTSKAEIPGVGTVNLTFTGRNTISITPKGQEGTTARVTTFTFPENFLYTNEQGDFTALVIEDAEGNQITINDPEVGVPLAINNIIAETAAVPTEVVEEFVTEEINYIKERKETAPVTEAVEEAPTGEQKLKDISEGRVVTFTYPNKQSIPDIFKDKVSSTINVTEKRGASKTTYKVTISQSEADYLLAQGKVAPTVDTEVVETTTELTEEQVSELNKFLGLDKSKRKAKRKGITKKDNQRLDKVERAVDLLEQSLSEVMPNIVISVAEDSDMFARFAGEQEEKKEDRSRGLFTRVDGTYVIVLNPDSADVTTVFHEGLHAVLVAAGLPNTMARAVTSRMVEAVKKTATKKLQKELKAFTELYKTPLQSEEYIAELIGILANNYNEQNNETKSIIRRWLQKLAEMLGLKPKGVSLSTVGLNNTDAATIDALNFVAKKMSEGGVLTEQDLTRLVQPGEEQQGDGSEETVTRKQKRKKPKNIKGLLDVMEGVFGLNKTQSESAAVVGDVLVETMAKRAGISKDEMYQRIAYQKAQKAPDGSLKQESPIFKSTAKEGLSKIQQKAATPEQWVKMITDKGGKGTSQELEWLGLQDYLNEWKKENKSKSVPKEVVEQYINDNQIEIVDVTKGGKLSEAENKEYGDLLNRVTQDYNSLSDKERKRLEELKKKDTGRLVKHSQYTLEGGENYREVLLTLPNNKKSDQKFYKKEHFDEANILAHLRINERTLPNGERVMFIEEVQSDWAQEGKKKGFASDLFEGNFRAFVEQEKGLRLNEEELLAEFNNNEGTLKKEFLERTDRTKTPDMPYKKTDQWVGMAMRRAMQMAAQEGFDRVAWVTGEQSAERYDLSKQIDNLIYDKSTKKLTAYKDSGGSLPSRKVFEQVAEEGELESIVGKEVAQKIIETNPEYGTEVSLRTEDLEIGGEGMKTFYNSILPKVAKKEAQRFDKKAKVEVVDFTDNSRLRDLENRVKTVRSNEEFDTIVEEINRIRGISKEQSKTIGKQLSIAITPEMRMNLNSAVPLFQGEQGAMLAEDGKYIVYALTDPNVSTPLHELAHVYEHYLTDDEIAVIERWGGHKAGTVEFSEKFARGFEKFLAGGKVKNPRLQKIFENFKKWLTEIYNGIKGSEIDIQLNDKMEAIYNDMLGVEETSVEAPVKETVTRKQKRQPSERRTERLAPNGKRSNLDDVGRVYPLGIGKSMLMGIKDDQYKPINDYEQYFDDKGIFERVKKMGVRVVELTDEMRKSNVLLDVEGKMLYDNVIAVDPKWLGKSWNGTNVIQHEAAHTYTVGVLLELDNTKLTPTEIEYKNDINSIFNSNKTFLNSEYGFNNSHEMVAEFLSNSKFRDYIEGNNLNLFQKIKKAVSSFLNKATDLKLSDVLSKYNNYVDSSFNQETQNIKLADGSNATFDPDAPSIRKQRRKKPKSKVKDAFEWGMQKGIPAIAVKNHLIKLGYTEEEITSGAYDAEKIWNKDGKKVVKWLDYGRRAALSARKFRPQTMFLAKEAMESSISAELRQAKMMAENLNRAINKYKSQDKRDELIDAVDEFMRDAEERDFWRNELPDDIAQIAEAMRVHIDSLSLKLVDSGVIKAESSRENILANIGVYMNRSYQVFDNKNWKEEVSEQVITAAQNHLREAYYNSLNGIKKLDQQLKDGKITESEYNRRKNRILSNKASVKKIMDRDNVSEDEALTMHVDDIIDSILSKKDVNEYILFAQPKVGKKDLSSLKRRKDIPPAIRALMGEYRDPGYNYAMSIFKIANLVENQKYLTKIRDAGLGVWLFEEEPGKKIPEGYEKITFKGDASMNPLDGLYAPKEVKEAFNDIELNRMISGIPKIGRLYGYWLKGVGAVKYNKTILSYGTHAKNVIGNMYFMAQNGYLDPREYQQPFIALVKQFSGKELTAEQEAKMDEWVRAGIIGQGATIGEIKSFFEGEDSFEKALTKRIDKKTDNMLSKVGKGVKKFGEKAQEAYQYEDDMFKIVAYEKEKLNYSKILFDGKSYNQLDASQQSTVNDYVAEIIKNILPNYGRIGDAGKLLKTFPIAGTFISFQIEAYRTAYNTVALAIQEIKGDIPGISETGKKLVQKRGVMRLISIVGFQAFKYGLISLLGIPLIPGDDDDEDGLSEKIRTLLPFWDTNSDISVREVKPNGNFTYVSISASDPYGSIFKVVNATKNSAKTGEGFSEIFGELSGPFVSEDILLNTLRNISSNENDYGGKIWRNTDPPFEKSEKIALQLYKTFEPGGITSTRKIIQSENKLNEALGQFTGFKLHEVKSLEQAGFKFGDIQKKAQESKSAYNSIKYNMDDYETQEDINKVIRASKKAMDEDYQEAVKLYQALISLGVSDRDIKKKMYDYGISGPMRSQIARNSVDVKLNPIKK